jgi:3-oxoacyl-[acyl-carrier protein] reductase
MFANKIAIVTGAARGIGFEITEELFNNGISTIYAVDILDTVNQLKKTDNNRQIIPVCIDVTDSDKRNELFKRVWKEQKRLDILVNNAGVALSALIEMHREIDIDRCMDVDATAVIKYIQSSVKLMKKTGGGSIVNISSIAGTNGNRGQIAYSAAKAAVIGITKSAAKELASCQIRVNAIAPGIIETPMLRSALTEEVINDYRDNQVGMHRIGTAQDITNAVMFFLSDKSAYVTGQILGVDGGFIL